MKRALFALSLAIAFGFPAAAQSTIDFERGFVPYSSYDNSSFDSVNLSTGTLVLHIPIISYPQRGAVPDLSLFASYNNTVWLQEGPYYDYSEDLYQWFPDGGDLLIQNSYAYGNDCPGAFPVYCYVVDPDGGYHTLGALTGGDTAETLDGTGFQFNTNYAIDPNGVVYNPATDPYGNTVTPNTYYTIYTDTIGRSIPMFTDNFSWYGGSTGCTTKDFPGPPGSTSVPIQVCYSTFAISTSFGVSGVAEWSSTALLLDAIILPNGTAWGFNYDSYGRLSSVTTPTGGTISYTWTFNMSGWPYDSTVATRTISDGTTPHEWVYTYTVGSFSLMSATKVSDPDGNDTNHVFNGAGYETGTTYYQGSMGSGTILKTVATTYSGSGEGAYGDGNPALPVVVQTTQGGLVSQVCTVYDDMTNSPCNPVTFNSSGPTWTAIWSATFPLSYGRQISRAESSWGSGSPGGVLRQTNTAYQWQTSSAYLNANLLNQPTSITTNGSSLAGETTYVYDESGSAPSGCTSTPCGARTTVNHYISSSSYLTSHTHYSSHGMPTANIDPAGNTTTLSYDSTGMFLSEIQYPVTSGTAHNELFSYDANTGLLVSHTDQNSNVTSYGYDSMRRPTSASYPDGGSETYAYTDSAIPNPYFDFTKTLTTSSSFVERGTVDGLGREVQTRTAVPSSTCSSGYVYVTMSYDDEGRKAFVSNPGCLPGTSGNTNSYDPLGRINSITEADGGVVHYYYGSAVTSYGGTSSESCSGYEIGYPILAVDEASKVRQSWIDALGRLVDLSEPVVSGSGFNDTCYLYDANGNLTYTIDVGGTQQRHFTYDLLSRLTSATNPESGTTTYSYVPSGGGLCAGDPSAVCLRTDARSITTSYWYDQDSRLSWKTYSDGTPSQYYDYDQSAPWGVALSNYVGRLTTTYTVSGGTNIAASCLSYDPLGRIAMDLQYIEGTTEQVAHTYNYAGAVTSISYPYPSGLAITTSYDIADHPYQITSSWSDSEHPNPLAQVNSTAPNGTITNMLLGNGLTSATVLNSRLQPCRMNVNAALASVTACSGSAPSDNVQDFQLGYGPSNNGNLMSWSGTGALAFNRTYGYDGLNRLNSLSDSVDTTCPGLSWSYDVWGNRTAQTVTSGTCDPWSQSYNTSNQIMGGGFTYDANGNILGDGSHTYTYDAENHMTGVDSGTTYVYDAQGRRVQKTSGGVTTQYTYDYASGAVLMEAQGSAITNTYVYLNDGLLAEYSGGAGGTTEFIHRDHLGSTRVVTSASGSVTDSMDYLPFGEQIGGDSSTTHEFTGYERDSESNLDNAQARYYSSAQGRFMSPDPKGGHLVNPQSLNRYSYVHNNPLGLIDPFGTDCLYVNDDETEGTVVTGDCLSDTDNGIFVDGTIDISLGAIFDQENNTLSFDYTPEGSDSSVLYDTDAPNPSYGSDLWNCLGCPGLWSSAEGAANTITAGYTAVYLGVAGVEAGSALLTQGARTLGWLAARGAPIGAVLGSYNSSQAPNYIQAAQQIGANALDINDTVWNVLEATGDSVAAEQQFIDTTVANGGQIYLNTDYDGLNPITHYSMELEYLRSIGVDPSTLPWANVPR